jgi:DNA-binding CsgD family transcriptional regulator
MWFPALRSGGRVASLHVSRSGAAVHYQPRELGLLELLAPHICRALAISDALDIRVLKSELLERTLDGLAAGVFLAARDGHIVYMNASAERQVRAGRSIRLVNDRLAAVDPAARRALNEAVEECGRDGAAMNTRNPSIGLPDGSGGGTVATLLPVADGQRSGVLAPFAASVAVFIQDPVHAPLMPGEAFARLHGLTGSELRVLMALSQGLGGVGAADMLGVGEPTIRTHLQRIYSKTGTSKQVDLLRLLHHSTPPTRLPTH